MDGSGTQPELFSSNLYILQYSCVFFTNFQLKKIVISLIGIFQSYFLLND